MQSKKVTLIEDNAIYFGNFKKKKIKKYTQVVLETIH